MGDWDIPSSRVEKEGQEGYVRLGIRDSAHIKDFKIKNRMTLRLSLCVEKRVSRIVLFHLLH